MTRIGVTVFGLWALALSLAPAHGQISASATITPQQLAPNNFKYSLTLTNTGSTSIGTLWFGWFPGYDLLNTAPSSFTSPSGWSASNAPETYGVASAQWVASSNLLQPGHSLSGFSFTTSDPPATIGGPSIFGAPVEQSYVYIGAPEDDPGFALTPTTVVPEPKPLTLLLGLPAALLLRRKGHERRFD